MSHVWALARLTILVLAVLALAAAAWTAPIIPTSKKWPDTVLSLVGVKRSTIS